MADIAYRRVHVVINPASGRDEPIVNTLNRVFGPNGIKWTVSVTNKAGDAERMAREAAGRGVDLIVSYGGDGTLMEVANGVMDSGVPVAVLPGGTGNAVAIGLNIPQDLRRATDLILHSRARRKLDMGRIGDRYFVLRAYIGIREDAVASREDKDRYGLMAYLLAAANLLADHPTARYRIALASGETLTMDALLCAVNNLGTIGGVRWQPPAEVSPYDGLFDLFVINLDLESVGSLARFVFQKGGKKAQVDHWQSSSVTVEADPPQAVWLDGERHGETPVTVEVVPGAVEIVVPE